MSLIDTLPDDTKTLILAGDKNIRDDLRLIPEAEAAGWTPAFKEGHWHNSADFTKGDTTAWMTSKGWTRAVLRDGRYQDHEVFSDLRDALGLVQK